MPRAAEERIAADLEADTKLVLDALSMGAGPKLAKLAPPTASISVVISNAQSSEPSKATKAFKGGAAVVKYAADLNVTEMNVKECDGECCKLVPRYDDDRSLGAQIREVCFAEGEDGRTLSKLKVVLDD